MIRNEPKWTIFASDGLEILQLGSVYLLLNSSYILSDIHVPFIIYKC